MLVKLRLGRAGTRRQQINPKRCKFQGAKPQSSREGRTCLHSTRCSSVWREWPRIEPTLTTIGERFCDADSSNSGNDSRIISAAAKKLSSNTSRSRAGDESAKRPIAPRPALFTRHRGRQFFAAHSIAAARTADE